MAALEAQAQAAGVSLAAAALRFAMTHPLAASVLIGTANPRSLARNLDAAEAPSPPAADGRSRRRAPCRREWFAARSLATSDRAGDLVGVPDRVHDVLHPPRVAEQIGLRDLVADLVVEPPLRIVADRQDRASPP